MVRGSAEIRDGIRVRHYSSDGKDRLVAIECDECGVLIAPNSEIAKSGWRQCGIIDRGGSQSTHEYCPNHADIADGIGNLHTAGWKT